MSDHCNKYRWHGPSGCPPPWHVACLDDCEDLDDVRPVYAVDAEEAAEQWASRDDSESADYRVIGGTEVTVAVRPAEGGETTYWRVRGESQPVYYADQVTAPEATS